MNTATSGLRPRFSLKIILAFILVGLADWLFYRTGGHTGWVTGLFGTAVLSALIITNRSLLHTSAGRITAALTMLPLIAMIEEPGLMPTALALAGMAVLVSLPKRKRLDTVRAIKDMVRLFIPGLFLQLKRDETRVRCVKRKGRKSLNLGATLPYLIIPALMSLAFIYLFAKANPLFAKSFSWFDLNILAELLNPKRTFFWILSMAATWTLLRPKLKPQTETWPVILPPALSLWINKKSLIASLCIFNLIFFAENALDAIFLWSGEALPEDMNFAEYAHSGAYPLIVTVILAALYVLLVFDDRQEWRQSVMARNLTMLWIGQNIFLTASAINRTWRYVEVYSLTHLRLAALVWMGLIVMGLFLIVIKILRGKNNAWLVNCNAVTLLAVLCTACFANYDRGIAFYNVSHAYEVREKGPPLDINYMHEIGVEALPALYWFTANAQHDSNKKSYVNTIIHNLRVDLLDITGANESSPTLAEAWRLWAWRRHRLLSETAELQAQAKTTP